MVNQRPNMPKPADIKINPQLPKKEVRKTPVKQETKEENCEESMEIIRKEMENAHLPILELNIPLIADTNYGKNWDEAH